MPAGKSWRVGWSEVLRYSRELHQFGYPEQVLSIPQDIGYLRERRLVGEEIDDTVFYGLPQREWQATCQPD